MKLGLHLIRQGEPSAIRTSRQGAGCFGSAIVAFGGLATWAGIEDYGLGSDLSLIGLGMMVVGLALAVVPWVLPGVDAMRLFAGLVCAALAVACLGLAVVVAVRGEWRMLALLVPVAGIWGLAGVWCLEGVLFRRPAGRFAPLLGGGVAVLAGLAIGAQASVAGVSEGVPHWVGALAGLPFLLAGVLILGGALGWSADGVLHRLLGALLASALAAVAVGVAGPLGLVAVAVSGLFWVAAYRALHQRLWGRDPLAASSSAIQLGVGCLVGLVLAVIVALGLWVAMRPPLPAEAPEPAVVVPVP